MSHAVVIVAIDPKEVEEKGSVEAALEYQMQPFDENGNWFKDGSRWDWYVIGGRWSGFFLGKDIIKVSEANPEEWREAKRKKLIENWKAAQADERSKNDDTFKYFVYGIEKDMTFDQYIAKFLPEGASISAPAFLRERNWHENGRMGWFGVNTATECERDGKEAPRICRYKKGKASTNTWNVDDAEWKAKYYDRFIKQCPDDWYLVVVDYHV